ncbi:thiamine phosphate synthase [Chthonobacter albigriseus]|uniref:thiamine phosphate synthase n=1 Tax=Chthonobacter albigriseus TaxID=1683161 RepID=UPI0015EF543B|nr:thiamine phosphate synthase [Chthonobacter albigriseus]
MAKKTQKAAPPPPRARLYLVTPRQIDLQTFPALLEAALAGGDVASLLIAPEVSADAHLQRIAEALVPIAQARDVAALVIDDTRAMGRSKADGLHVEAGITALAEAVEKLEGRAIVGAGNLKTRHEAMEAAEAGTDYVMFGLLSREDDDETHRKTLDFAWWWAEMFEIPCVALAGRSLESVEETAETGAEFVAVRSFVWDHPDGPGAAVAEINRVLDAVHARRGEAA